MSLETLDRDAIFANAIEIASPEERDAYIARACGGDAALRREVEQMVAAHFQAAGVADKAPAGAALPPGRAGARQADGHAVRPRVPSGPPPGAGARTSPRGLTVAAGLLMLAVAGGSAAVAVWAWKGKENAQAAEHKAVEDAKQARQEAEEAKKQHDQAEVARESLAAARDEAVASSRAAQQSVEDSRAVLAFFEDRVLSAGRRKDWGGGLPKDWSRGLGKKVTLRQALDAAEPEVAKAFANRPLAEATIREMLGAAYDDLEEAPLAVKQLERALALREKEQGPGNPDAITCRNKLAVALRHAGRDDDASRLAAPPSRPGRSGPGTAAPEHKR